jgi:alkylation response protein AidB-like acyl-CoA dehydrogenase
MSDMKFRLSDEQRALVGTVRDLVRTNFSGRVMKWQDGTFPWENMHDLAKIGVLGMSVPRNTAAPVSRCSTRRWCWRRSQRSATRPRWR